ncbi:MAG: hypothetical protein Q8O76_02535 [Chloroflexota bacterium]|nr:hypothetical protein [Chloroflexota bacterium]
MPHADGTVGVWRTVQQLLDGDSDAFVSKEDELVELDCTRDLKFRYGVCRLSKELADALGMREGARGQLTWVEVLPPTWGPKPTKAEVKEVSHV